VLVLRDPPELGWRDEPMTAGVGTYAQTETLARMREIADETGLGCRYEPCTDGSVPEPKDWTNAQAANDAAIAAWIEEGASPRLGWRSRLFFLDERSRSGL
jgi:hypothetical protein